MFNNRFNSSKNDPLVEAVKAAQHDGECRRQAEKIVNEEFGVYSRKAVVREQLAAYDAALEEVYANLKEGIAIQPSEINPVPRKPEVGSGDVPHQTGSGKTINPKDNKEIAVESKKLAKKDYDKDGKIETSKKEVWGSRLRAAKASGKYKGPVDEKKDCYEESDGLPPSDAAKQAGAAQQSQTPKSTPARTGNAAGSTISNARAATGMQEAQLDELKKPTAKTATDAYHRAYDSDVRSGGEGKRTARLGRWKQKNLPDKSARNQKDTGKSAKMNEAQLDELSRTTLKSYVKKANRQANDLERKVNTRKDRPGEEDKMYRRIDGVNLAHDKMKVRVAATNEEALDEISKELAGRYIKQADYKRSDSSFQSGKVYGKELATKRRTKQDVETSRKHNRDAFKREKGINTAVNKLTGRAKVAANEEVMKESIVAKLFAKHMKEDSSFKSAQVIEANAFDLGKTVPDTSMKIRGGAYPSVAARLKDMAGIAGRGLARGLGNPVSAGVMAAMEPTPANSGENEFARQAKYAPKTASAPAVTPKPAAPAPTSTAAPTPAPAKPGFYKGGSQGDYTIKKGDTLSNIAKNTGQSVADLAKMNNISDVNKISSGAKLMTKVPTPPSRPADATPSASPAPAPKPAEPEFKGRMIPPSDSGVGATPPAASFVNSRREMRSGGPATAPLTSKDFGRQPPASMQESVQVGANKYRIV